MRLHTKGHPYKLQQTIANVVKFHEVYLCVSFVFGTRVVWPPQSQLSHKCSLWELNCLVPHLASLPGSRSSYFSLSTVLFRSFPIALLRTIICAHDPNVHGPFRGSIHPALISQSSSLVPHQMCVPYCWLLSSNSTVPKLRRHVYRIKGKPSNSVTIWVLWCSLFQMCYR